MWSVRTKRVATSGSPTSVIRVPWDVHRLVCAYIKLYRRVVHRLVCAYIKLYRRVDTERSCSLRVPQTDVSAYTGHYCWCTGTTVSFAPHELVHIRRQHVMMNSLHSLELRLDPVPVGLDILRVNARDWMNEVQRMVDHLVLYHRTQLLHTSICCPRVTIYFGPTPQMALHNGQ